MINVKVGGAYIEQDNKYAGVQGEANVTNMRITFDEGWNGYAKTVTFWDALMSNPVKRDLTLDMLEDINASTLVYIIQIPGEAMTESGSMTYVIDGYIEGKRRRSVKEQLWVIEAPSAEEADEPTDPTPTQAEQLQTQIDTFIDTIQSHAQTASKEAKTAIEYSNYAAEDAEQAQKSAKEARNNADEASKFADEARESAEQASENAKVSHINQGEGERSLVFNDEERNRALASDSISAGTDTISGCKGYYISAIDFENKKIYLSETLVSLPATGAGEVDLTFATPAYEVGNDIGIMFYSHRLYFATIASVENNIVTYNGDLGFDASNLKEDADGYEFFVPQHPEIGSSVFTQTSFGFGEMIRAIGRCCALFGSELFGGNYTGLFGRNNKASTYSIGGGYGNISSATHAFFSGVSNILKGYCVGIIGANSKVNGVCSFVSGDYCELDSNYSSAHGVRLKSKTDGQHLFGTFNKEDPDAAFIVGVGHSDALRKNGFVAKKDGSATVSKQGTSDDSAVQKKYVDDAFATKVTPLQTVLNKIEALFHFGTGGNSIMLGGGAEASGTYSGSWGLLAKAKGYVALALGYDTKAEGGMTLAANRGTTAKRDNSTALGQYNSPNYTDIFQVGNGTSDTDRKNAFVVNMDGHAEVQVQGETDTSVVQKKYVDEALANVGSGDIASNPDFIRFSMTAENAYNKAIDAETRSIRNEEKIETLEETVAGLSGSNSNDDSDKTEYIYGSYVGKGTKVDGGYSNAIRISKSYYGNKEKFIRYLVIMENGKPAATYVYGVGNSYAVGATENDKICVNTFANHQGGEDPNNPGYFYYSTELDVYTAGNATSFNEEGKTYYYFGIWE